jgi:hypothetical protein
MARKVARPSLPEGVQPNPRRVSAKAKKRGKPKHGNIGTSRRMKIYAEVGKSDDATAALMAGNLLETYLARAILTRIRKLSAPDHNRIFDGEAAVLGRFHAKIQMGWALNIYGKPDHDEMMVIKTIRNRFAHRLHVRSFNSAEIKSECAKLIAGHYAEWANSAYPEERTPVRKGGRNRFLQAVAGMVEMLDMKARRSKRPRIAIPIVGLSQPPFQAWLERRGQQHRARTQDHD